MSVTTTHPGPAIVLVEDEPDILSILRRLVQDLVGSYEIITVNSGAAALAALEARPVPLIITDYTMPGMNGLQLAQAVKAASPATTVALITAYSTVELEQLAQAAGADHYLPKPFRIEQLETVVREALS